MNTKKLFKGYVYVIISAVVFGFMPIVAKFIYKDGVTPASLAFLRNLLSLPFLLILMKRKKNSARINPKALLPISFTAFMVCLTSLLLYSSYNHISSGTATVLHFIYPAAVVLGEFVLFKSKMTKTQLASVIICVIGIALFYNPQSQLNLKGSLFALFSGITYAAYIIGLSSFKYKEIPTFTFSFYLFASIAAMLFVICVFTNQLVFPKSPAGWIMMIIFAITFNVAAAVLFQTGTFIIGGAKSSILSTLEPVTSVLAGFMIFDETLTALTVAGTLLVICASILVTKNTK